MGAGYDLFAVANSYGTHLELSGILIRDCWAIKTALFEGLFLFNASVLEFTEVEYNNYKREAD
ncbi:MAG: hypothetical protein A3E07_03600 [Candidatus Wildermuthbacteria bacterium RIFCSPHIGHO2_12_FULL_45_9]|uniref:Uncharacterized protein n=1 Tax=Candidatus Wildermuthbacteria bacterium RIFCSPHIGHO2_02_FULL_45_25 TaxID=1802450 RepID=A0A1G2R5T8_9BACT|nr:MAG: hypothetical protein A2748_03230 [Candidatus Wildermuthbacteria bacterium RIFCSPHIGHO2_01_FULL_45_20]OHA67928.1 MAG: hypothetical protein A3C04_04625 [Candidatus Wildermuthbacteria bacterium RIFCSPHIGHO2_02_FULL_45_25]OHA72293.1 MAG: hypothetical protein A3E07_03600 [Candidatus Wildermuthbacteria bacterium RIFCSPHIGHO2_12_FULL_45_9]